MRGRICAPLFNFKFEKYAWPITLTEVVIPQLFDACANLNLWNKICKKVDLKPSKIDNCVVHNRTKTGDDPALMPVLPVLPYVVST